MTSSPHQSEKQALRRSARRWAAELAPRTAAEASAVLCELLQRSELYRGAGTIMAFLPLPKGGEPDLTALLEDALASGKRVCLPRVDWESGAMEAAAVRSLASLVTGERGLREPTRGRDGAGGEEGAAGAEAVRLEDIDLILVPGLAFDRSGNRLGRGAGFYDRFLAGRPSSTMACGICFEAMLVDRIPTDEWDVPVNVVATERRLVTLEP